VAFFPGGAQPDLRGRRRPVVGVDLVLLAGLAALPGGAPALSAQVLPPPTEAEVHALLQAWETETMLGSLALSVSEVLPQVGPSLDRAALARIDAVVTRAFARNALYPRVVRYVRERATAGEVAAFSAWLLADDVRGIQAKVLPDVMPESFTEYAERIEANRPPQERFDLIGRMVHAQRGGEFYILTGDHLRASAERIVDEAMGPGTAVSVELTRDEDEDRRLDLEVITFVSFMKRYEPLTDAEAQRLLEGYESAAGQWWMSTYADAVLFAIDVATEAAISELR
jgi:hypothetical protein